MWGSLRHKLFGQGDRLPARFMLMPPQAPDEYEDTVWTDILFMRTFNMSQSRKRMEKHVCPLPIDIVKRLIVRYSNPGEIILDPFTGIGTVPASCATSVGTCTGGGGCGCMALGTAG